MSTIKQIVCLANSRKISGRCVAGRELLQEGLLGPWIRPVSARGDGEVSLLERRYQDGQDPRLLEIINIPLLAPKSEPNQPENWLLDPNYYWQKVGEFARDSLQLLADVTGTLWANDRSTYNGLNDFTSIDEANASSGSLKLIPVSGLQLSVYSPGEDFGNSKRRVQAILI
jgi:hypothetical protein